MNDSEIVGNNEDEECEEDDKSTNSSVTEPKSAKVNGKKSKRKRKKWTRVKKPRRKMSIESDVSSLDCEVMGSSSDIVEKESNQVMDKKSTQSEKKKRRSSKFVELVDEAEFKPKNIFTPFSSSLQPKAFFECICGMKTHQQNDTKCRVQCVKCRLWQHAACVNHDLKDPLQGEFKCPHCHVSSVSCCVSLHKGV